MSDLISRQAAISAICNACGKIDCDKMDKCEKLQLPPANCSEFPNNSDTISRQDAVSRRRLLSDLKELITAWEKYPVMAEQIKGVEVAIGYVELIPSAQPEIIRCRNCKFASGDSRICMKFGHSPIGELDFCAWAERRTDE